MERYNFLKYSHFHRWTSYWHQISEVLKLNPSSVLIIGKGDGTVSMVLKKYVDKVDVLDIEASLMPDIVGSVSKMPIEDNKYDVVLCAQVLEHLPFEKFAESMSEMKRVTKKHIVISLPYNGLTFKFLFKIPFLQEFKYIIKIPGIRKNIYNGEHYWEIGKKGYAMSRIKKYLKILD